MCYTGQMKYMDCFWFSMKERKSEMLCFFPYVDVGQNKARWEQNVMSIERWLND